MNRTIKLLMISDIFLVTGFGLIDPILAIFIKEDIAGGTIFVAGIAGMIFLITKSIVQLPFSRYVDKHDDCKKWLIAGTLIVASVPIIYIFAKNIITIFIAQFIYGVGSGLAYSTWLRLWSVNLDKKHQSFQWSLYSTFTGLGTALAAAIGAGIAQYIGFEYTFLIVSLMALAGGIILLFLENKRRKVNQITLYDYMHKQKI